MTPVKLRLAAVCLVLGVVALSVSTATFSQAQTADVDPNATKILKKMTDYLGQLKSFSLETDNIIEDVVGPNQKIQYDFTAKVVIQRPNRIRAERTGDLFKQLLLYNGQSLTIYNPDDNYFAVSAAPDNIDDLLHFARETLDIVPPIGDVVFSNAFELLTANITTATVIGKSMVGGVKCDHLAFTSHYVDWQIWIAEGDKPLPYKYVLTTKDDPVYPQYMVFMSNWNTKPKVKDSLFEFKPPKEAKKIEFLSFDTGETMMR